MEPISTYKKGSIINVLNMYPTNSTKGQIRTMHTDPNNSYVLPKSASIKAWLEGGTVNGVEFSHGIFPDSKQQIMKVTLKSIDEFEIAVEENESWIYKFDVTVIGFWDGSANFSLSTKTS